MRRLRGDEELKVEVDVSSQFLYRGCFEIPESSGMDTINTQTLYQNHSLQYYLQFIEVICVVNEVLHHFEVLISLER